MHTTTQINVEPNNHRGEHEHKEDMRLQKKSKKDRTNRSNTDSVEEHNAKLNWRESQGWD